MALPLLLANILGGVGQGVGAGGQAVARERESALDRQRQTARDALLERQVRLSEEQYANERNDREVLATEAANNPELAPYAPLLRNKGGADVVKWLAELNAKKAERERALGAAKQAASLIPNSEDTMKFVSEEEGAGMSPVAAEPKAKFLRGGLESGAVPIEKALPFLFPEKPSRHVVDGALVDNEGRVLYQPPAPTPIPPPEGTRPVVKVDPRGRQSVEHQYPPEPKEPRQPSASQLIDQLTTEYQKLIASGVSEDDPRAKALAQRINNQKLVPYTEGGGVQGPMGVVRPPSQKPPEASERKELAGLDTARAGVQSLIKDFDKNQAVLGNIVSNPVGALRRGAGGVLPTLSQDERRFLSGLALRVADLKRELIGLAQTIPELRTLADALPDKGEIGPAVFAKLKEIDKLLETKRSSLGNVLQQSNRSVPTPMGQTNDGWTITERKK